MANAHRTNVLVTSCLKTPVDPHTKAPVALYEREKAFPYTAAHMDHQDYEKEMPYEDSDSEYSDEDTSGNCSPVMLKDYRVMEERINLHEIFFSNEEYYSKLEELKQAHLRTMAELENMYRRKLQLKSLPPGETTVAAGHRFPWSKNNPPAFGRLWRSHSAVELRRGSGPSDASDEDLAAYNEKGLLSSPKEHIKNMWQDFKLSPRNRRLSSSSFQSLPDDKSLKHSKGKAKKKQRHKGAEQESWKHRTTVPQPFKMTLREADRRRRGIKTRSEVEQENAELRRQLEELTECQRTFRASPVPAHVRLPLYEGLREREEERRLAVREREEQHLRAIQKPFSFLERERLKRERREEQLRLLQSSPQKKVKPFKAKPVPKAVYEAASGEQVKEEQLYRSIKMQMRAKEMLYSASMPPSMLARRLNQRENTKGREEKDFPHRPQINRRVPDFDASFQRFRKHLENRKEVKPVTTCEPFQLRTSQISSHRERILADIEKDHTSPRVTRWPHVSPGPVRTPSSSLCSSLSGSLELLPAKVTEGSKKRQEAVRKTLEERKKAEEDEERWRERRKRREKKLQRVVLRRALANDPHMALSQTCQSKLKEFRKQDLQRRREYQQEIREIQERVKGRPLLLEQVAQKNAKQAAEKRYADTLHGCGLTEDFIRGMVPKSQQPGTSGAASKAPFSSDSRKSNKEDETDISDVPVQYREVYLNAEDEDGHEEEGEDPVSSPLGEDGSRYLGDSGRGDEQHYSDDSYHYSEDHDNSSDDGEHDPARDEAQQDRHHSKHSQSSDGENGAELNEASDQECGRF